MSGIQLRAGWWRQRCGHVVRVRAVQCRTGDRWQDEKMHYYGDDGRCISGLTMPEDLVEFLGEEIEIIPAGVQWHEVLIAAIAMAPRFARKEVILSLEKMAADLRAKCKTPIEIIDSRRVSDAAIVDA